MDEREAIKVQIQNASHSEEEVLLLAKEFDSLKRTPPEVLDS
jgi:hypothetical protein